jgi:hypothetical protein
LKMRDCKHLLSFENYYRRLHSVLDRLNRPKHTFFLVYEMFHFFRLITWLLKNNKKKYVLVSFVGQLFRVISFLTYLSLILKIR